MDTTKYNAYEAKIEAQKAELKAKEKRIAELERQNTLLLKYAWNTEGEHAICRGCGAPEWLDEHFEGCDVFAAIDSGTAAPPRK